jgi:hypothetical protein
MAPYQQIRQMLLLKSKNYLPQPYSLGTIKKNRWDVNFQSRNSPTETNPFRSSGLIARGGDGGFTSNQRTKTHMIPNDTSSIAIFSNAPFFQSLQIYTASNVIGLLISLLTKSHIHLDLIGTGAFAIASILPYMGIALQKTSSTIDASLLISSGALGRITLSTAAVTIWGTKLAGFLFYRAMQLKKDQRLVELFKTVSGTCTFWSFSLVWGILCSLPHTLGLTSSASGNIITLSTGTILYILGLVTESLVIIKNGNLRVPTLVNFATLDSGVYRSIQTILVIFYCGQEFGL